MYYQLSNTIFLALILQPYYDYGNVAYSNGYVHYVFTGKFGKLDRESDMLFGYGLGFTGNQIRSRIYLSSSSPSEAELRTSLVATRVLLKGRVSS